jgi:ribosomal protein S18 acetylase RimI-like enzyme
MVNVRRADSRDLDGVKALLIEIEEHEQSNQAVGLADRIATGLTASRASYDLMESDAFWVFIAAVDERLVGYATVARVPKLDQRVATLFIDELYVLREFRRQGVASSLLVAIGDHADALGAWMIRLVTEPENEAASALYRRAGFTQHGGVLLQRGVP